MISVVLFSASLCPNHTPHHLKPSPLLLLLFFCPKSFLFSCERTSSSLKPAHCSSVLLIHVLHHPHFPSTITCRITVSLFKCHHLLSLDLQRHSEAPSDLYYQHSQKETLHLQCKKATMLLTDCHVSP